ncbi:MAG: amidase [Anaerolineae bacterium]|nr:amidase [Anaerolineae bacterium]
MQTNFETQLAPLAEQLRSGTLNLMDYLAQLEAYFETENERVQAFLPETNRFARLRQEASVLEAQFPNPADRPVLYGIPMGIKDIFHVDGFETRAGSQLPPQVLAGPQAESVSQLQRMGALILGKTVTTEFAYFGPGPTRNPHNIKHTPGGSSSGSAAAVGAHLSPLTLGTQTIGSIVRPASFCGVVGFKPSSGRISTAGVIPLSPTLDHIGIFTQDVAGATLAASVLCSDWQTDDSPSVHPTLGIPDGPYLEQASSEGLVHFQQTVSKLEQAGYTVKTVAAMPDFHDIYVAHNALMAAETTSVHHDWFAEFGDLYHPKTIDLLERGKKITLDQIEAARLGREYLRQNLEVLMDKHNLDLWISPAAVGTAPAGLESTGDPIMNLPWTYAGVPAINLPSGLGENGLPLGLQLAGRDQGDEQLLAWAESIASVLMSFYL